MTRRTDLPLIEPDADNPLAPAEAARAKIEKTIDRLQMVAFWFEVILVFGLGMEIFATPIIAQIGAKMVLAGVAGEVTLSRIAHRKELHLRRVNDQIERYKDDVITHLRFHENWRSAIEDMKRKDASL